MTVTARLISVSLAVLLHVALLLPAWLGGEGLRGGIGGKPDSGVSMTVSLAQLPRSAPEQAMSPPTPQPRADALRTEQEPEPEPEPREEQVEPEPEPQEAPDEQTPSGESDQRREAQRQSGDGRAAGEGADTSGDRDNAWNRYLGEVRRLVERHKTYPRQARLRRQEGEVRVRFALDAEGRVTDLRLVESSGSALLDRHVERLIERLELPPPPADIDVTGRTITLPVRFRLN